LALAFEKAEIHFDSYWGFVGVGAVLTFFLVIVYFGMALLFDANARKTLRTIIKRLTRKARRNNV
jgi:hypothetical protein